MSLRGKEPGKGRGSVERWQYQVIPNGSAVYGFSAGVVVGAFVHLVNRASKPCRALMTDGQLACPHCAADTPKWRGYVPYWDAQYTRRFVLINEDYYESVEELKKYDPIKLSRAKSTRSPVVITGEVWRTQPIPRTAEREREVDLMPFLLSKLWNDLELSKWHISREEPLAHPPVDPLANGRRTLPPDQERAALVNGVVKGLGLDRPNAERRSGADILAALDDAEGKPKRRRS